MAYPPLFSSFLIFFWSDARTLMGQDCCRTSRRDALFLERQWGKSTAESPRRDAAMNQIFL
jgi:hypothetical protein